MLRRGNPLGFRSVEDLASNRVRFLNRVDGSGSRLLLDFLPVQEVAFNLIIPRTVLESAPVNKLLDLLQQRGFRNQLDGLPGYATAETGKLISTQPMNTGLLLFLPSSRDGLGLWLGNQRPKTIARFLRQTQDRLFAPQTSLRMTAFWNSSDFGSMIPKKWVMQREYRRTPKRWRAVGPSLIQLCVLGVVALLLAKSLHAAEIHVFAAASLTDALKEIAGTYEKKTGDKIYFNLAASSVLARQIEEGAPADLFFSADEARMDGLDKKGLLVEGTRKSLLSNSLVIVVPPDSTVVLKSANALTGLEIKRIALGEPKTVPVGVYARAYLEKLGVWKQITPKIVPTENVRASLAAVESGNVEAGIVYKTDALISKKVKVAFEVPTAEGPAISYPAALVKGSKVPAESKAVLEFLESKLAATVFEKYGFIVKP